MEVDLPEFNLPKGSLKLRASHVPLTAFAMALGGVHKRFPKCLEAGRVKQLSSTQSPFRAEGVDF